jgi:hypothetical protein
MLIDTRRPPPPDIPPPNAPRGHGRWATLAHRASLLLRNGGWGGLLYLAGLVLIIVSSTLAPVPGYVVLVGVCLLLGLGLGGLTGDPSGLKDHRQ